jgi:uncharacterized protein with HEPN domain
MRGRRRAMSTPSALPNSSATNCDDRRVCFCLLVVGEACIQAAKESPTLPADVPWGEIRGMRNLLVHEYWQIDDEIIYNVARREAEPLARRLDGLINEVAQRT